MLDGRVNVTVLFGHRLRQKGADQAFPELNELYRRGWRGSIFFVDDNFIGNSRYLRETLLPALIERRRGKKGLPFHTEVSVNLADDAILMELMAAAGFDSVFVGIETPDNKSLKECGKNQNRSRDLIASIGRIQRAGLEVQGDFIVGFDSDPISIFQRQIDFIQRTSIVTAMVGLLQAPAGTKLFERLRRENRLAGIISGDNVEGSTNIIPKMGLNALLKGYRAILSQICSHRHYYKRVTRFLQDFKTPDSPLPWIFSDSWLFPLLRAIGHHWPGARALLEVNGLDSVASPPTLLTGIDARQLIRP
jgi:hypothetical protein